MDPDKLVPSVTGANTTDISTTEEDSEDSDQNRTRQNEQGLLYMFDSGLSDEMLLVLSILVTAAVSGSTCFCLGFFWSKSKRLEDDLKGEAECRRLVEEERQARVASLADL